MMCVYPTDWFLAAVTACAAFFSGQ